MNNQQEEFERIAGEIEAKIDHSKARIRFDQDDEGGVIYGTKDGYILYAARLIKAVLNPEKAKSGLIVNIDDNAITTEDSFHMDYSLYVTDAIPVREKPIDPPKGSYVGYIFFSLIVLVILLAGIGVGAVINWFR